MSQALSEELVESCTRKLNENIKDRENVFRSQYDHVHHNLDEIISNETYSNSAINDFKTIVSKLAYNEDIPLGMLTFLHASLIFNLQKNITISCSL